MKKMLGLIFVAVVLFCSTDLHAHSNTDETHKVKERIENFLKAVSEKNYEEIYKYAALVVYGKEKTHIKKIIDIEEIDEDTNKEILEMLSEFRKPEYRNKSTIRFNEREKNFATVEYEEKVLENFKMVLIDGQWYFAMEIFVD